MSTLKEQICSHVKNYISDKQFNEEFSFVIPILHFDMNGYICIIKSHDVRHVNKRHPHDINYICEIPEIIENFHRVKKSIIKKYKTSSSLINLEFYKKYDNNIVKLVKLKLHIEKRLELKTIFIKEEQ